MTKIHKYTKLTLLLLSMTTMMSNVAIVTVIPHLKEHFSTLSSIEFLARMMVTAPSLAIALLAPFLGHVIHRFGKYRSAIVALILFSVAGSAGLYLQSMQALLVSRFCLGVAVGALMIVTTSLVGDYFNGEARHRYMGLQSLFVSLGGVFFVLGGGLLADVHWRYPFGIYLIGLVLLPLSILFLEERPASSLPPQEEGVPTSLFKIYLLAFTLMLFFYIMPTQMPFLIINHFGASSTMAGMIISLAFLSNGIGAMMFAKLKQRFSFLTIYALGMFIISVGFMLIGTVRNISLFFITSPIMGFGGGLLMTTVAAWMLSIAPLAKRVKASGYLTSSLFLGQFFSPIIFYPLVSFLGVQDFFVAVGASLCMAVVGFTGYQRVKGV